MPEFDEIIHQSTRLRIMAALMALQPDELMDFSSMAKLLQITDGNLGAHILKLEEAGYLKAKKSFIDRKPRTHLSLTSKGRHKFEEHVQALQEIVRQNGKPA